MLYPVEGLTDNFQRELGNVAYSQLVDCGIETSIW